MLAMTACGGGGSNITPTMHSTPVSAPQAHPAKALFSLRIPPKSASAAAKIARAHTAGAHPAFVDSANTASVSVTVDSQPAQQTSLTTTGSNPACVADTNGDGGAHCTLSVIVDNPIATGSGNTFTITTFDAGGNALSTSTVMQTIVVGQITTISTTLTGITRSFSLAIDPTHSQGANGNMMAFDGNDFVMAPPIGGRPQLAIAVTQKDSDGAIILAGANGAGLPPLSTSFATLGGFTNNLFPQTCGNCGSEVLIDGQFNPTVFGAATVTVTATNPALTPTSFPTTVSTTFNVYSEAVPGPFSASFGAPTSAQTISLPINTLTDVNVTLLSGSTEYIGPVSYQNGAFSCPHTQESAGVTDAGNFIISQSSGETIAIDTTGLLQIDSCQTKLLDAFGDGANDTSTTLTMNVTNAIVPTASGAGSFVNGTFTIAHGGSSGGIQLTQVRNPGDFQIQQTGCSGVVTFSPLLPVEIVSGINLPLTVTPVSASPATCSLTITSTYDGSTTLQIPIQVT